MSNKQYPEVRFNETKHRRIKHVAQEVYLCVKTDPDMDKHTIATKTAQMDQFADSELDFSLHYYDAANGEQPRMVLIVHEATSVCFSMTDDNKLLISGLHREPPVEDPRGFTDADERFFYLKDADNNTIALQATNGIVTNTKYFLAVDGNEKVNIVENTNESIPNNLRFYLEDPDVINFVGSNNE